MVLFELEPCVCCWQKWEEVTERTYNSIIDDQISSSPVKNLIGIEVDDAVWIAIAKVKVKVKVAWRDYQC